MVISVLDNTINYKEYKMLNDDDKRMEVSTYVINVKDIDILCALGKEQYTYIKKSIIFFPLYLVHNGKVKSKIGVYEIMASELESILDDDNDIDIDKLEEPLLFSFVTKEYLQEYRYESDSDVDEDDESDDEEDDDEEDDDEEDDDEEDDDVDSIVDIEDDEVGEEDDIIEKSLVDIQEKTKPQDILPSLKTLIKELYQEDDDKINMKMMQDDKLFEKERQKLFKPMTTKNWVQKAYKNDNYKIIDNEGKGDCLFATIRDAYKGVGKDISVSQLRQILKNEVTQDFFDLNKTLYDSFSLELKNIEKQLKELKQENIRLKNAVKTEKDISQQRLYVSRSKSIIEEYNKLKEQYEITSELLEEYEFMEGIETIDELKEVIQTCNFWGEGWSISIIEKVLNIKLIILSRESYESGDYDGIIQCGDSSQELVDKGIFKPKYYIILSWLGKHYQLVEYRGKTMMTFDEIPNTIKEQIYYKCLEKGEGIYGLIPKFQTLVRIMNRDESDYLVEENQKSETELERKKDIQTKTNSKSKSKGLYAPTYYNKEVIFQYYEISSDKNPGKGSGEKIKDIEKPNYIGLQKIKNWRRYLANGTSTPFNLDGKSWDSVDHYFYANMFKSNPEHYNKFSIDSGSEISSDYKKARTYMEKNKKDIDKSFLENPESYMFKAMMEKYKQNEIARDVLLLTKDALLMKYIPKREPIEALVQMKVREELAKLYS